MEYIELGCACTDCVMMIADGDTSGMDDATETEVRAGIASFGEHAGHVGYLA